jgi:hypothetical protein
MLGLSWNRLADITKNEKPYRGSDNRYPVGNRRHNTKCFYAEELNGERVYRVTYGNTYDRIECTKEDYDADPQNVRVYEMADGTKEYARYLTKPSTLGIVRSDNTFEFTGSYYGQGDNQIMTSWTKGILYRSSRHGGMVYREGNHWNKDKGVTLFHPIFKGMRLYTDSMKPHESSVYKVVGKKVNRKVGNEFLKRYETFYSVNEAMLKAMEWKGFLETAVDVVKPHVDDADNWWMSVEQRESLLKFANENIDVAPLDAGIAFMCAYDVQDLFRRVRSLMRSENYWSSELDPVNLYTNLKRKLNKELYRSHPEVMTLVEYDMGIPYPASEWGVDIYVNGKEVEQY